MNRFIYVFTEEELGEILAGRSIPLEVVKREKGRVFVAAYEPIEGAEFIKVERVSDSWKKWKESFGPVEVEEFVVMPPWKVPIFINPGMAFGTGLHPTTRLCIRLIKDLLGRGESVLDVGAGSGILSIVARKLGAGRVLGIDVSEDAVHSCRENAKLNGADVECRLSVPSEVNESFDLVVANLELSIFVEELDNLIPLFTKGAIFSGIYGEGELKQFLGMLRRRKLSADKILEEESWFAVAVRHERS